MAKQLIIQHDGRTLYAGEGDREQWRQRLSKGPSQESYHIVEVDVAQDGNLSLSQMQANKGADGDYFTYGHSAARVNLDDKAKGLLKKVLEA